VRPRRFERLAYSSGGCRSIQLSYGRDEISDCRFLIVDRRTRSFQLPVLIFDQRAGEKRTSRPSRDEFAIIGLSCQEKLIASHFSRFTLKQKDTKETHAEQGFRHASRELSTSGASCI
jgi:hypothetical protein